MSWETPEEAGGPLGLGTPPTNGDHARERTPPPLVDPRPYRMMIGALALVLLVGFSIYRVTAGGMGTLGVPPGIRLRYFAAPLATSSLRGDANVNPPCSILHHDPRALNVCLLAHRGPLVLVLFVTGSASCVRQVDTLQAVSSRFRDSPIQFAAVAVRTGPVQARAAVRAHHWSIPVAYDRDGAVGALYGAAVCPLVELAGRGGIVAARLVGDRWLNSDALAGRVRSLLVG
ncbi:MAG TPA: TlpA disulfide reductase family protein [Solirubrobacteraceae bacterium]